MPMLTSVDYRLSKMVLSENFVPTSIESILLETHSSVIESVRLSSGILDPIGRDIKKSLILLNVSC